jgi:uncharacterized protein (DUF4415 family)
MNKSLTNETGEVRELTTKDFKSMKLISDFPELQGLVKKGRPKKDNPKKSTTIRLDAEVLDFFKARGKGWQTEINNVLQDYVDSQSA